MGIGENVGENTGGNTGSSGRIITPPSSFTPYLTMDFQGYTVGDPAAYDDGRYLDLFGSPGFPSQDSQTIAVDPLDSGNQVCKIDHPFNVTTGTTSNVFSLPELPYGGTAWVQFRLYLPAFPAWQFGAAQGTNDEVKLCRLLRLQTNNFASLMLDNTNGEFKYATEEGGVGVPFGSLKRGIYMSDYQGAWHTIEFSIETGNSATSGFRLWIDHVFMDELVGFEPIRAAAMPSKTSFPFWANWNDGVPQNQSSYIDNIKLAYSSVASPTATDGSGNLYIGQ